jgi:NADH oxidase (H2O2-forming)
MPDSKEVTIKVIAEAGTGRILGGQAIGGEGAAWRVNMIAEALRMRMTLQEFASLELAYCPAVSELYDPLLAAVDVALQRVGAT